MIQRKAYTLIEIIFTIVILAGIFMVIPKILMVASKHENIAIKQDAYFNAISLTKLASSLAWDENNTDNLSILKTTINNIPCDSLTHIRQGSFLSAQARVCQEDLNASTIGSDEGSDYLLFDDIDDFDGATINTTLNGNKLYTITTAVDYLDTLSLVLSANKLSIDLNATTSTSSSTNIKKLTTTIKYSGKKAINHDKTLAKFHYYSANIGQFTLNKREW